MTATRGAAKRRGLDIHRLQTPHFLGTASIAPEEPSVRSSIDLRYPRNIKPAPILAQHSEIQLHPELNLSWLKSGGNSAIGGRPKSSAHA